MIKQINILDMLDMYGEDSCREILSTFICSLNIDVADFIAQLGRNYSDTAKEYPINGKNLLHEFYSAHDFVPFGNRKKDNNELADSPILVQMLRYFKS